MQWNSENLIGNNGNTIDFISFDRLIYDRLRNLVEAARCGLPYLSVVFEIRGFQAFRDGLGMEKS